MKKLNNLFNQRAILVTIGMQILLTLVVNISYGQVGELLWEDNFNTINEDIWSFDTGDGCSEGICGWGNSELEYYRQENASIVNVPDEAGNNALLITAKREAYGGKSFTSARLKSYNGIAVKYGMIEFRAQMPNLETGLWPALWMLGTTTASWPAKGEIDIMEMGQNLAERSRQGYPNVPVNSYIGSNLIFYADGACSDANPTCAASAAYDVDFDKPYTSAYPLVNKFITYRLYWTSEFLRFTLIDDGVEHDLYEAPFYISDESSEFQEPFYFLMNLAVGGSFTDATSDNQVTAPFDARMLVDYVRVYKYNGEGEVIMGNTAIKESGTFGVFTDNTPVNNQLVPGENADIYAWKNFAEGSNAPYEGNNVISWKTTDAGLWFGGGIMTRQPRDMSNFNEGNLKFRIKIPANIGFKIGITDNYTNQYYVNFPANQTAYGLVRNGDWGQATIPISELTGGIIALQSMQYLFAIVNNDAGLPTSTFEMALDDIYWEGGGDIAEIAVTGVTVAPATTNLKINETQLLTATLSPSGATNKKVTWSSSNNAIATVNSNGLVVAVAQGTATITVTTEDGGFTSSCTVNIINDGEEGVTGLDGTYIVGNRQSGLVMDVAHGDEANGTNILQYYNTGAENQQFIFTEISTGIYSLINVKTGKCVDVEDVSTDNFANIHQWEYVGGRNQQFKIESTGNGYYKLRATHSNKIIEVGYASLDTNANINQYDDNNQLCGQWKLIPVTNECSIIASTGDFKTIVSNDEVNPALTFVPLTSGIGDNVCILYYSNEENSIFPGIPVTPGQPVQINATGNETIYFYYTYSLPTGGENTTVNSKNSFTPGICGSLKHAISEDPVVEKNIFMYPVPASDYLVIEGVNRKALVIIYDMNGKTVFTSTLENGRNNLDIRELKSGAYFIKIPSLNTQKLKFIKN
jgi:beta-glucanase (GH16 family)